jgi:hypothetical protein
MSTRAKARSPEKRVRGPNIRTIIEAAAKAGRHLVGVVSDPHGNIELKFAAENSGDERGATAA